MFPLLFVLSHLADLKRQRKRQERKNENERKEIVVPCFLFFLSFLMVPTLKDKGKGTHSSGFIIAFALSSSYPSCIICSCVFSSWSQFVTMSSLFYYCLVLRLRFSVSYFVFILSYRVSSSFCLFSSCRP